MGDNEREAAEDAAAAPRKDWVRPLIEVLPMDATENAPGGLNVDGLADYS